MDLFSGKPFLIIKTADGFKLKCQGEDLGRRNKTHEFEFKLPKKDFKSDNPKLENFR